MEKYGNATEGGGSPAWFCGLNASLWAEDSGALLDLCRANAADSLAHLCFLLLVLVALPVVGVFAHRGGWAQPWLIRSSLHSLQWILMLLLVLLCLGSLAEGLLTDATYRGLPTQPHLYVPASLALAASCAALPAFHLAELWRLGPAAWAALPTYWGAAGTGEAHRLLLLSRAGPAGSPVPLRFYLSTLSLAVYAGLFALQINNIRLMKTKQSEEADTPPIAMRFTQKHSSFLSESTFWWMNWLFRLGYTQPLEMQDLGNLPSCHTSSAIHARFKEAYRIEKERAISSGCRPSLWRVYLRLHGCSMAFALVLKIIGETCSFAGPLALNAIIAWVSSLQDGTQIAAEPHFVTASEFFQHGLVLVGMTFIVACLSSLFLQNYEQRIILVGVHCRSAIQTMVFEKSLRLPTFVMSSGDMTMGQITNHMSTDALNTFYMIEQLIGVLSLPIKVTIALSLLIVQLGYSAVIGMAAYILTVPLQTLMGNHLAKFEENALAHADERLKLSNEMLQAIRLLKMYGWEQWFGRAIEKVRKAEFRNISKMLYSFGVLGALTEIVPLMVMLLLFGTFTALTGEVLTPGIAFTSLSLFMLLQDPLYILPMTLLATVNGAISTGRLAAFLAAPEVTGTGGGRRTLSVNPTSPVDDDSDEEKSPLCAGDETEPSGAVPRPRPSRDTLRDGSAPVPAGLPDHTAIRIVEGSFAWDPDAPQPTLAALSVDIEAEKLTMVVGTVGSGKSSLLSAILEEMVQTEGRLEIHGSRNSIAYAGQKAWLLNASFRENILFGRPFNRKRYQAVISACALQADIDLLPAGDRTEIGEKGINLSGGQKQRVSVARAIYSEKDIVLLDDPLSALDVHVGGHLFQEGIMGILKKRKRTIVLVSHQLQYLPHADKILLMRDGRVAHEGRLEDIVTAEPDLYSGYEKAVRELTDHETETETEDQCYPELMQAKRRKARAAKESMLDGQVTGETYDGEGRLIAEEEMERGSVSGDVYLFFAKAMKLPVFLAIVLIYPLEAGIMAGGNFWLSKWSQQGLVQGNGTDTSHYIKIYAVISLCGVLNAFVVTAVLITGMLTAADRLFHRMFQNVIRMPMRFFDSTPVGRTMNRLSADTQIIDMKMAVSVDCLLFFVATITAALVINAAISPIFLVITFPFLLCYFFGQKVYITTSRELQRLDSTSKSPVFSCFSETLGGLSTIRAYRKQQSFFDTIIQRVNANNTAFVYLQTSLQWLSTRLDVVGAFVVLASGLTSVLGAINGTVDSGLVGLGMSYALMVSVHLKMMVRHMSEVEMQMNSVERVKHYTTLTTECYQGKEPPPDWPSRGAISVSNVWVRYAPELGPVLRGVSVDIKPGERIGICGRTGSGKSSLTLALLRIVDTFKGRILIDGVDIATVPLTTLRQRLSIIPQDPVLFNGTIRMNLDPEGKRKDWELWDALEIAQLKDLVTQMDGGLDSQVAEGGENFSLGQRQLFCLARAFLRHSKVLIMDEATASIDVKTDRIIQHAVSTAFEGKTVLTIAHRVGTILNSDTILTLREGEVIEHDTPDNLLANPDSVFASFVDSDK